MSFARLARDERCAATEVNYEFEVNKSWRHLDYETLRSAEVSEGRNLGNSSAHRI